MWLKSNQLLFMPKNPKKNGVSITYHQSYPQILWKSRHFSNAVQMLRCGFGSAPTLFFGGAIIPDVCHPKTNNKYNKGCADSRNKRVDWTPGAHDLTQKQRSEGRCAE